MAFNLSLSLMNSRIHNGPMPSRRKELPQHGSMSLKTVNQSQCKWHQEYILFCWNKILKRLLSRNNSFIFCFRASFYPSPRHIDYVVPQEKQNLIKGRTIYFRFSVKGTPPNPRDLFVRNKKFMNTLLFILLTLFEFLYYYQGASIEVFGEN